MEPGTTRSVDIDALMRDTDNDRVTAAIGRGVREALRRHKLLGQSVAEWDSENQCVIWVKPEDIPDFPEDEPPAS